MTLEKILLTHGHIDHCGGTAELRRRLGLPIEGPHARGPVLDRPAAVAEPHVRLSAARVVHPRSLARRRRHGAASAQSRWGAPLPGAHAGPRRVLPARRAHRVRRRRAVPGLDRPHRFSARRLRHAGPLDHDGSSGRSATTSPSCRVTDRSPPSAPSAATTPWSATASSAGCKRIRHAPAVDVRRPSATPG